MLAVLLCLFAVTPSAAATEITVFAAASLKESMQEIADAYRSAHGGKVRLNIAGSQILAQQIISGARCDVFASADASQMDRVQSALGNHSAQPFTASELALAVPSSNPGGVSGLADLRLRQVRIVLADKTVPAGAYTQRLLDLYESDHAGSKEAILANVVSYELNVRSVLSKLQLGEADAGFVYITDVAAASGKVRAVPLPKECVVTAEYPVLALTPEGMAFVGFLLSERAQRILIRHGFREPNTPRE